MFTAALFSIAKTWKQPKDECIKMWRVHTCVHTHIHTLEYYSGITRTHTHTHTQWNTSQALHTHTHTHTQWNTSQAFYTHTHTHTHTMEYYSGIKKEQNNAICSNTDTTRN